MKFGIIIQARCGSTRLPNKILKKINNNDNVLEYLIKRVSNYFDKKKIFIATTKLKKDIKISKIAKKLNIKVFLGSEKDVLSRYSDCSKKYNIKNIIRLTSDCPLIDPCLIDEIISSALERNLDYYSNTMDEKYPDGQDIEIFRYEALEKAWFEATLKSDREHVTPYIIRNSTYRGGNLFHSDNHFSNENYNNVRMTVDEPNDLEVIKLLISNLGLNKKWQDYTEFYLNHEDIQKLNKGIERNQGYNLSIEKE